MAALGRALDSQASKPQPLVLTAKATPHLCPQSVWLHSPVQEMPGRLASHPPAPPALASVSPKPRCGQRRAIRTSPHRPWREWAACQGLSWHSQRFPAAQLPLSHPALGLHRAYHGQSCARDKRQGCVSLVTPLPAALQPSLGFWTALRSRG